MKEKNFTIVIADDHPMLLAGLYEELTANGYQVVAKANNGRLALEKILTHKPTLALLDIDMPLLKGFEVVREAMEAGTTTKFIMLSFHKEKEYLSQAKALHIDGYLLKEDSFLEIERCMEQVASGGTYFSRSFDKNTLTSADSEIRNLQLLTASEKTILKLIAQQFTNNQIAEQLFVSTRTVEKHRSNIINKLNLDRETNSLTNWALINKNVILNL